ncbi:hypothetical protein GCM10025792_43960 [Pseudonocardia tropica]
MPAARRAVRRNPCDRPDVGLDTRSVLRFPLAQSTRSGRESRLVDAAAHPPRHGAGCHRRVRWETPMARRHAGPRPDAGQRARIRLRWVRRRHVDLCRTGTALCR